MNTFKHFLNEQKTEDLSGYKLILKIVEILKSDCDYFLTESNGFPMYRGSDVEQTTAKDNEFGAKTLQRKSIRTDRKPRHSGKEIYFQWAFNTMFKEHFDIDTIRSRSLFCSGLEENTQIYGSANFVFPIGKFNYVWSPKIEDSYEHFNTYAKLSEIIIAEIGTRKFYDWIEYIAHEFAKDMIAGNKYDSSELKKYQDPYLKLAAPLLNEYFKSLNYKMNERLEQGLKSGNEIFIVAPSEYYLVPADAVRAALGIPAGKSHDYIYSKLISEL